MALHTLPADDLSRIRVEVEQFVSRENKRNGDPWLQQVGWVEVDRTLTLVVRKPPPELPDSEVLRSKFLKGHGSLRTLFSPMSMRIYFPASLDEKPFCFSEDDALARAAEAANKNLLPVSCNSILSVTTTILKCIKRDIQDDPQSSDPLEDASTTSVVCSHETRAKIAAKVVVEAVKEDVIGADLALALFSLAVSSYRRDTVATPFPKQLETGRREREYKAFVGSLETIPAMHEISLWTDPERLLKLPPVALLALHFVLVSLPTKLRTVTSNTPTETVAFSAITTAAQHPTTPCGRKNTCSNRPAPADTKGAGYQHGVNSSNSSSCSSCSIKSSSSSAGRCGVVDGRGRGVTNDAELAEPKPSHVFDVVLPADPAFDSEATRGGSTVAYHGSSPENFHSILNNGLKVMSETRLMKNGAAFGSGIYLAASLEAAYSFAKRGDGQGTTVWGRSIFGNLTNSLVPAPGAGGSAAAAAKSSTQATSGAPRRFPYRLVVKCRVLTGEGAEVKGSGDQKGYYVVSDASKIRIEGLLLFDERQSARQTGIADATITKVNSGDAYLVRATAATAAATATATNTTASAVQQSKVGETPRYPVCTVDHGVGDIAAKASRASGTDKANTIDGSIVKTISSKVLLSVAVAASTSSAGDVGRGDASSARRVNPMAGEPNSDRFASETLKCCGSFACCCLFHICGALLTMIVSVYWARISLDVDSEEKRAHGQPHDL